MAKNFVGAGPVVLDVTHAGSAALTPGDSVYGVRQSDGTLRWAVTTDSAGDHGPVGIVIPDHESGKGAGDDYAAGDRVKVCFPQSGQLFRARVNDSAARNAGSELATAAAGAFKLSAAATDPVLAVLLEDYADGEKGTAVLKWMRRT